MATVKGKKTATPKATPAPAVPIVTPTPSSPVPAPTSPPASKSDFADKLVAQGHDSKLASALGDLVSKFGPKNVRRAAREAREMLLAMEAKEGKK